MCIIIANKIDPISREYLYNSYKNNDDGIGIGYVSEDDRTHIMKFHHNTPFETFYRNYLEIRSTTNRGMILHFRIATHGKVSYKNTHPFKIDQNLLLAHNGIIPNFGSKSDNVSDTIDFMDKVLKPLRKAYADFYADGNIHNMLSSLIGHSKLAFLDEKGELFIVNDELGIWEGEDWYSNESYLYEKKTYTYSAPSKYNRYNNRSQDIEDYYKSLYGNYENYNYDEEDPDDIDSIVPAEIPKIPANVSEGQNETEAAKQEDQYLTGSEEMAFYSVFDELDEPAKKDVVNFYETKIMKGQTLTETQKTILNMYHKSLYGVEYNFKKSEGEILDIN